MIILLTAFLAGASPLPQIDRTALDLQARAEALQPRSRGQARTAQPRRTTPARAQATRPRTVAAATPTRSNKASTPPRAPTPASSTAGASAIKSFS